MKWSSAYRKRLPDQAFAYVCEGERKLPIFSHIGTLSVAHLRNALARLNQTDIAAGAQRLLRRKLQALLAKHSAGQTVTWAGWQPLCLRSNPRHSEYPRVPDGALVDGRHVREGIPNLGSISSTLDEWQELPGIREVPMADFVPSRPHSASEAVRVDRLAAAIEASREIAPLIVVIDKEGPYILEGGHRFLALHQIGARSFPALVVLDTESLEDVPEQNPRGTSWSEVMRRAHKGSRGERQTADAQIRHKAAKLRPFADPEMAHEIVWSWMKVRKTPKWARVNPAPRTRPNPRRSRADEMSLDNPRCSVATLRAFGVNAWARDGGEIVGILRDHGFVVEPVPDDEIFQGEWSEPTKMFPRRTFWTEHDIRGLPKTITLAAFIQQHPTGAYYLSTPHHAMALIDGKLTDTAKGSGRRRLHLAFRVRRK